MNIEMTRRSFLWTSGAVLGAIGVGGLTLPAVTSQAAVEEGWVYDAALGICRNPGLSRRLRRRAALRGGRRWVTMTTPRPQAEIEINGDYTMNVHKEYAEYGRAMAVHGIELKDINLLHFNEFVVRGLTQMNRCRLKWYTLPEVRAGIPYDAGWNQMVGWYGVAAK